MVKASASKKKKTTRMTAKSGTCHSTGNMKEKTISEITKTMKKTVKPQSGVQLGAAFDNDNNVQDKPDKTMDVDVMETNVNDIIDKEDNKEDTEDSDTYSRNKKMYLSNKKSTSKKAFVTCREKLEK